MSDITRYRGDTRRIRRTVTSSGAAVDITGWGFVLTVNAVDSPTDTEHQVAQIVGVIADAPNGIVDFTPTLTDIETAGNYFYDIESIDANGAVSTLDKGSFTLLQDITKSVPNPGDEWIADGVNGTNVSLDGSEFWYAASDSYDLVRTNFVYAERDGTKVAALKGTYATYFVHLYPCKNGAPIVFSNGAFEFSMLTYLGSELDYIVMGLYAYAGGVPYNYLTFQTATGGLAKMTAYRSKINNSVSTTGGATLQVFPGWKWYKFRVNYLDMADGGGQAPSMKIKLWNKGTDEPAAWTSERYALTTGGYKLFPSVFSLRCKRGNAANILEIASFRWEQVE